MKRVLITPLDWGLGHATRCIPIIKQFMSYGVEVILAGSGQSLELLKMEFPALKYFILPGYDPVYPRSGRLMVVSMIRQLPKFYGTIRKEKSDLEKIVADEKIDIIISDNRYGCWSRNATSVLITHQSNILMPKRFGWLSGFVRNRNFKLIQNFNACWIPDLPGDENSLAGELQAKRPSLGNLKQKFIGHPSRFRKTGNTKTVYDVCFVLSGPEPQRSILESIVVPQLETSGLTYCIVRGIFGGNIDTKPPQLDYALSAELQNIIECSSAVICRSGYSSIMDLAALEKKAILIPTPGQTEQEYLAARFNQNGMAVTADQNNFNLKESMKLVGKTTGFKLNPESDTFLRQAIDELVKN